MGVLFMYIMFVYTNPDVNNAPRLFYENEINIEVKKISFQRNYLYLNNILYNAGGISGYSRVYSTDNYVNRLENIKPPFKIEKEAKNDTLRILKENKLYFLLVTQEQNYVKSLIRDTPE